MGVGGGGGVEYSCTPTTIGTYIFADIHTYVDIRQNFNSQHRNLKGQKVWKILNENTTFSTYHGVAFQNMFNRNMSLSYDPLLQKSNFCSIFAICKKVLWCRKYFFSQVILI